VTTPGADTDEPGHAPAGEPQAGAPAERPSAPFTIDTTVAHPARVYDYLLGGNVHFAVDRDLAEHMSATLPGGIDTARANVRSHRAFVGRAVRHLATELGVRQFLDLGTGIPSEDNVHGVALSVAPDSRIVYVDNDPIVLAHAHALLAGAPQTTTAYIDADLRDTEAVLGQASKTLDFGQPVAAVMAGILHFITDEQDPAGIVTRTLEHLTPGSYLVITHLTEDLAPVMEDMAERSSARSTETLVLRTYAEVSRYFDGLELIEPGLVQIDEWPEPGLAPPPPEGWVVPLYVGVARKP
jgi:hypothetical protein